MGAEQTDVLREFNAALDKFLDNFDQDLYDEYVRLAGGDKNSNRWQEKSTSLEIDKKYPNWLEGTTNDNGKHTTQVEGTRKTYNKVGDWIEKNLGKDVRVLDASSGMGYGTADLRERGFNIEDVEPYQSEERKKNNPATYSSYDDVKGDYDVIISNAVLNVIPDDWRADVLHNMVSHLSEGGKLFINTRKAGEEKSIKDKIELDSPQEVLVKRNGKIASYQRFFTPKELKEYVEQELGEGYSVEVANEKNSGTKGLAAVVVTREGKNDVRYSTKHDGVWVSADEYAKISHQIQTYPKKSERGHVFTDKNYYLCTDIDKDGNFRIKATLPIEGNEDLINEIRRNEAETFVPIRPTESTLGIIKNIKSRGGRISGDYASVEGLSTRTGGNDSVHLAQQADTRADRRETGGDSGAQAHIERQREHAQQLINDLGGKGKVVTSKEELDAEGNGFLRFPLRDCPSLRERGLCARRDASGVRCPEKTAALQAQGQQWFFSV